MALAESQDETAGKLALFITAEIPLQLLNEVIDTVNHNLPAGYKLYLIHKSTFDSIDSFEPTTQHVATVPTCFTQGTSKQYYDRYWELLGQLVRSPTSSAFANVCLELDDFSIEKRDLKLRWIPVNNELVNTFGEFVRASFSAAAPLAKVVHTGVLSSAEICLEYNRKGDALGDEIFTDPEWQQVLAGDSSAWRPFPSTPPQGNGDLQEDNGDKWARMAVFVTAPLDKAVLDEFLTEVTKIQNEYSPEGQETPEQTEWTILTSADIETSLPTQVPVAASPTAFLGFTAEQVAAFAEAYLHEPHFSTSYCAILDEQAAINKTCLMVEFSEPYYWEDDMEEEGYQPPGRLPRLRLLRTNFRGLHSVAANFSIGNMSWSEFYAWGEEFGGFVIEADRQEETS